VPVEKGAIPQERYCGAAIKQFTKDVVRFGLQDFGVSSIYFGGGTPSLMRPDYFEKILWAVGTTLVMQSDIEITCEVNPATTDADWFRKMVSVGVNRFSIGVQSFQKSKLKALGRCHTQEEAQRAIAEAQDVGAKTVSVDMMYGLPQQSLSDVEKDLKEAMTFQPQHISAYQLTVEPGTPLHQQLKDKDSKLQLPQEDDVLKQLRLVKRMLESSGWEQYEISNYAKPNHRCRHNLHYWRYGSYLGLGSGATSFLIKEKTASPKSAYGLRSTTTRDVMKYIRGRLGGEDEESISARTAMGEYCFLGLRTSEGIALDDFEMRFGKSVKKAFPGTISDLEKRELICIQDNRLCLTPRGMELSNQVFTSFVE